MRPLLLASLLFPTVLFADLSPEQQLIKAVPACDMNQDGKLTPSEIWYARNLSKAKSEPWLLASKLIESSYTPSELPAGKRYGSQPGKKIKLFILSGQSNMVGQGLSAELSEAMLKQNDRILMFEAGKWQPLRPFEPFFGPEMAFAHTMAKQWPGETIGIVKQSIGGTGVLAWHPQWTKEKAALTNDGKKGNLWKALTDKVKDARAADDCEVMGFIWMQGGKDMLHLETGNSYLQNLKALVEGLRNETGIPKLPLVLGSYRIPAVPDDVSHFDFTEVAKNARPGYAAVLIAQQQAEKTMPPAKMIPLRNLETHPHNVHYNTAGQLKLGELFAQGYVELTGTIE
jgi:hypothetical protein